MKMLSAVRDVSGSQIQPWLLTTPAGFAKAVERLKRKDRPWLFIVLTKAAASGEWQMFNAAMEQATGVSGVSDLLDGASEFAIALLYGRTGLPRNLYPLFQAVVKLSLHVRREIKGVRTGRQVRTLILDKVFQRSEIEGLNVPQEIRAALYA